MPSPPTKTTLAFDDGGDGPGLSAEEWAILEKFHRGGYDGNWNQKDKVVLTNALQKAYGRPGALRETDLAKIMKWISEGRQKLEE